MPRSAEEERERYLGKLLVDPTRKSPRGAYRYAYTETQFDRRLKDEASLPFQEEICAGPVIDRQLEMEQSEDLVESLGLSSRQMEICRYKMEGCTVREIAEKMHLSERRVWSLLGELRKILMVKLVQRDDDEPGSTPYYGWQEVYLDTQRRKGC